MKTHSKIMLQALSLAVVFTISSGNMFAAAAENPVQNKDETVKVAAVVNEAVPVVHEATATTESHDGDAEENEEHQGEAPKKGKKRKHRGRKNSVELRRKRIKAHAMRHRLANGSLFTRFNAAKEADPASIVPGALNEIGMIVNDADRRLALFKFIQASSGKSFSADEKALFRTMLETEVNNVRKEVEEVRELVGVFSVDNNFALIDEADVLKLFSQATNYQSHNHSGAPKRKSALDTDRDGKVSKEERKAARMARKAAKKGTREKDLDTDHDGKVTKQERKAARMARNAAKKAEREKALDTDGDGKVSKQERKAARMARKAAKKAAEASVVDAQEHKAAEAPVVAAQEHKAAEAAVVAQ